MRILIVMTMLFAWMTNCLASAQTDESAPVAADTQVEAAASVVTANEASAAERFSDVAIERVSGLLGTWGRTRILEIEAWRYVFFFTVLLATLIMSSLFRWVLSKCAVRLVRIFRWHMDENILILADRPTSLLVTATGFWLAIRPMLIVVPPSIAVGIGRICAAVAAFAVLWYLYRVINVLETYLHAVAKRSTNSLDDAIVIIIRKALRIFIVVMGFLLIGQNIFNMNVTAILASAGVFGIAIAFAAQDTIANLFGTVMLMLDKPLKIGERVVVGGADGTVEAIGFRSTRIRNLDGHLVSVPNKEVANLAIQNIGRRPYIKRVSNITITYDTPIEKVERAVTIIRGLLDNHEGMDKELPARVYFNEFNDCSLNILMIAWYHPADYWMYLEWCERFNLALMRAYEAEGIEFAFPTTTTYLAQDNRRSLAIRTESFVGGSDGTERPMDCTG